MDKIRRKFPENFFKWLLFSIILQYILIFHHTIKKIYDIMISLKRHFYLLHEFSMILHELFPFLINNRLLFLSFLLNYILLSCIKLPCNLSHLKCTFFIFLNSGSWMILFEEGRNYFILIKVWKITLMTNITTCMKFNNPPSQKIAKQTIQLYMIISSLVVQEKMMKVIWNMISQIRLKHLRV